MESGDVYRTRRILVVDDDASIREMIALALEDDGFEVLTAPEGKSALAMIPDVTPDVILLDTRMPVMDGWEFAREYQQMNVSRVPLIILSAIDDPATIAADIGADAFLAKPFDLNDLSNVLSQYLDGDN